MNMMPDFPNQRRALQADWSNEGSGEIVDGGRAADPPEDVWWVKKSYWKEERWQKEQSEAVHSPFPFWEKLLFDLGWL
jgi:hypothetical protein